MERIPARGIRHLAPVPRPILILPVLRFAVQPLDAVGLVSWCERRFPGHGVHVSALATVECWDLHDGRQVKGQLVVLHGPRCRLTVARHWYARWIQRATFLWDDIWPLAGCDLYPDVAAWQALLTGDIPWADVWAMGSWSWSGTPTWMFVVRVPAPVLRVPACASWHTPPQRSLELGLQRPRSIPSQSPFWPVGVRDRWPGWVAQWETLAGSLLCPQTWRTHRNGFWHCRLRRMATGDDWLCSYCHMSYSAQLRANRRHAMWSLTVQCNLCLHVRWSHRGAIWQSPVTLIAPTPAPAVVVPPPLNGCCANTPLQSRPGHTPYAYWRWGCGHGAGLRIYPQRCLVVPRTQVMWEEVRQCARPHRTQALQVTWAVEGVLAPDVDAIIILAQVDAFSLTRGLSSGQSYRDGRHFRYANPDGVSCAAGRRLTASLRAILPDGAVERWADLYGGSQPWHHTLHPCSARPVPIPMALDMTPPVSSVPPWAPGTIVQAPQWGAPPPLVRSAILRKVAWLVTDPPFRRRRRNEPHDNA